MLDFIKSNWTQILWGISVLGTLLAIVWCVITSVRCSLRNDILLIYDQCRVDKKITPYQKEAIHLSADLYKKLHGNSFVESIVKEIDSFQVI